MKIKKGKKVAKINKETNEIVEIFDSLASAAQSVNGHGANITVACNPKYKVKTYKGFIWKYIEDIENSHEQNSDC